MINSTNFKTIISSALNTASTNEDFDKVEDLIEDAWALSYNGFELNETLSGFESRLEALRKESKDALFAPITPKEVATIKAAKKVEKVVAKPAQPAIVNTPAQTTIPAPRRAETIVPSQDGARRTPTTMTSIKITASQHRILSTLLNNDRFTIEGHVELKKTTFKVDATAQASLIEILEELAVFNPRSFNSLVAKVKGATPMAPPANPVVIETAVIETPLVEEVKATPVHVEEKPMNATQRRMVAMTEEDEFQVAPFAVQQEEVDTPLFSPKFKDTVKKQMARREERVELPADHWTRKPKEERRASQFIKSNFSDETAQPIPQPVNCDDIW